MRALDRFHPYVVTLYVLLVAAVPMFYMNPILLSESVLFSAAYALLFGRGRGHWLFVLLFIISALINPLVSHNGVTVLFVLNDAPITLEATAYGVCMAAAIVSVLYWFRIYTEIMTSDKLLCLLGRLSPKLSLIVSMSLRYVSLLSEDAKRIRQAQTAVGLYREDSIVSRVRGGVRIFSILTTRALENGIVTADSMAARGYGIGPRTHFSIFRFALRDGIMTAATVLLFGLTVLSITQGGMTFVCYPSLEMAEVSAVSLIGYLSYGLLCALPIILETEAIIRWKYLRSKI